MNVNTFAPLGVRGLSSVKIPWGESPAAIPNDLFVEAEVREILQQENTLRKMADNGYLEDLDPAKGRYLHVQSDQAGRLQGGQAEVVIEALYDADGSQTQYIHHSREKNTFSEIKWSSGQIQNVREERVLGDGTKEVLQISVDPKKGLLTYKTDLIAGQHELFPANLMS